MEKQTLKAINDYIKKINYNFLDKPLVIGGMALQYYGIRKSGKDIDLMVSTRDWNRLLKLHPDKEKKFLFGKKVDEGFDATITLKGGNHIDLIKTLLGYTYSDICKGSLTFPNFRMASIEKILFIKTFPAIAFDNKRNLRDINTIICFLWKKQKEKYDKSK